MQPTYCCVECGAANRFSPQLKTVSCRKCGDVCFITNGELGGRMYPSLHMRCLEVDGVESKWMLPWTRPLQAGTYELRFRTTEPHIIRAWWNLRDFVTIDTKERIAMRDFLTWRGVLA
jgi:hypothetical protein